MSTRTTRRYSLAMSLVAVVACQDPTTTTKASATTTTTLQTSAPASVASVAPPRFQPTPTASVSSIPGPTNPRLQVEAMALTDDYVDNSVAADIKYKDQRLLIKQFFVKSIETNVWGRAYLHMGDEPLHPKAYFLESERQSVALMRPNDNAFTAATLECTCMGLEGKTPILGDCLVLRIVERKTWERPDEKVIYTRSVSPVPGESARTATGTTQPEDGADPHTPILPAKDEGFVDARGGWGWGDKCYVSIKAQKWGWAKAECDEGMKMSPAAPQPRASLLYNEGLIAKAAGDLEEARRNFEQSLALRDSPAVRAELGLP